MSVIIETYKVVDMLSRKTIYTGTHNQCVKYLDKNPELWLVCEIVLDSTRNVSRSIDNEEIW